MRLYKRKHPEQETGEEKGAIIVEATISLSVFMFAIFTLLSVIQIAYTQSRISVALCAATKQVAQYAHIYYMTGMDETMGQGNGKSSELFNEVGEFIENLGGELGSVSSELGQLVTDGGTSLQGDSLFGMLRSGAGSQIVLALTKKNLVTGSSQSPEDFLKKNHVEDLDMGLSSFLEEDGNIFMSVNYTIKPIKFFNWDVGSFRVNNWAYAQAWQ